MFPFDGKDLEEQGDNHDWKKSDPDIDNPYMFKSKQNIYANRYKDTSKKFRGFWYLMKMWKGSVMKLIWHDLLAFLMMFFLLSILYRTVFIKDPTQRQYFEMICIYASRFRALIPITFLTGFYVSQVVSRYWDQFMTLPWPDRLALKLVSYIPGKDEFRRNLRRTCVRYINLSCILAFRLVSQKVHSRFPTYESLIESKLILPHEAERLKNIDDQTPHESTWVPILWALKLIQRARSEKKIEIEAPVYSNLVSSFEYIEQCNRTILNYGWVNFPLCYTQVATLSVVLYFFTSLFACQYLIPEGEAADETTFPDIDISFAVSEPYKAHTPDFYIPFFTIVEFISYMGWIKVAEDLLNPFGDDDEDFQINYLIDRNLQVSYMIVDQAESQLELSPDPFLEAGIHVPSELPYTDEKLRDNASRMTNNDEPDHHRRIASLRRGVRKISSWTKPYDAATPSPRRGTFSRNNSVMKTITEYGSTDDGDNNKTNQDSGFIDNNQEMQNVGSGVSMSRQSSYLEVPSNNMMPGSTLESPRQNGNLEGINNLAFKEEEEEILAQEDTKRM